MSKDKVRIAIIGAGTVAYKHHIPAFLNCDDAEVLAVCDLNKERADKLAEQFKIPKVFYDVGDLLTDTSIDAVSICTGNHTHHDITIESAKAGKHILCEKPMAINVEQAVEMKNAVEQHGVTFMMGFVNRFRIESRIIREFSEKDTFGEIYYARCGWLRRRGSPSGWFTDSKKSGGGPVIDIGVHVIDLTWYLMGRPKPIAVSGVVHKRIGQYETKGTQRWEAGEKTDSSFSTEDSANALIRFENDVSLSVDVSWAINGKEEEMYSKLYGTKGGASFNPLEIYREENNYLTDTIPIIKEGSGWQSAFEYEINHFIECIKKHKAPISSVEEGLTIQKMLTGIYDSAARGREIDLT